MFGLSLLELVRYAYPVLYNSLQLDSLLSWVYVGEVYDMFRLEFSDIVSRQSCMFVDYSSDLGYLCKSFPSCGYLDVSFV